MTTAEQPHVHVIPPPRFFFGVSAGAAILFVFWTWLVHPSATPAPEFDSDIATYWQAWSAEHRAALGLVIFMTDMGGIAAMTLLAVMGAIWQTAIKHRTLAFAWLGIIVVGAMLNQGVKEVFGRSRPPNPAEVVHEKNASYPSGHAMGSAIGYGLLGYALILPQRHRPRRIVAVNFMIVIVLGVGFSRMYLRAHWFSDVLGGWALGVAWLFLCLGWLERRRRALVAQ
ncbi:MAG: phosphatase PAP2 family protein [Planctomycetes bacterium]|nr:phosphatase PAP2 family protein [Planctomycetota bacterium]